MIHSTTLLGDGEYLVRVDSGNVEWVKELAEEIGEFHIIESGWLNEDISTNIIAYKVKQTASTIKGWDVIPEPPYTPETAPKTLGPNYKITE